MKYRLLMVLLLAMSSTINSGCKDSHPQPDAGIASKLIQDLITENGNMPGGNMIDIHRFDIKSIEFGGTEGTASIRFEIDFTRYPTSGLDPEKYHSEPVRQTENHVALLALEKNKWTVREMSLY